MSFKKEEISELTTDLKKLEKEAQEIEFPQGWFWHKDNIRMLMHVQKGLENDIEKLKDHKYQVGEYLDRLKRYVHYLRSAIERIKKKDISATDIEISSIEIKRNMEAITSYLSTLIPKLEILEKHYSLDPNLEKKRILIKMGVNFAITPLLAERLIDNWDIVEEVINIYDSDKNDPMYQKYYYIWDVIHHFDKFIYLSLSEEEVSALRKKAVGNKTAQQIYQNPEFMDDLKDFLHKIYLKRKDLELQNKQNFRKIVILLAQIIYGGTTGEHLGDRICRIAIPNLSEILQNKEDLEYYHDFCLKAFKIKKSLPVRITETLSDYKFLIVKNVFDWKEFSSILFKEYVEFPKEDIYYTYHNFVKVFNKVTIGWEEYLSMINIFNKVIENKWGTKELFEKQNNFLLLVVNGISGIMNLSKKIPIKKIFEFLCELVNLSEKKKIEKILNTPFISSGFDFVDKGLLSLEEFYQGIKNIDKKLNYNSEVFSILVPKYGEDLLRKGISLNNILLGLSYFAGDKINKDLIELFSYDMTSKFWEELTEFSARISSSKHNIRRLNNIFQHLNQDSKVFLKYLIMFRPNQVLDIFEKYVLINKLGVDYNQEMKLFLKIASPITLKINNFSELTSILLPIKDLSAQKRNKFTSFLDSSRLVFQGLKSKFTEALSQIPGFENIENFSFIELVYIYLKHSENPDLNVKKIKKKLAKIRKNGDKIIGIISDKKNINEVNDNNKSDLEWKKQLKVMEELKYAKEVISQEINKAKRENEVKKKIREMTVIDEKLEKSEEKVNKLFKRKNDALRLIENILNSALDKIAQMFFEPVVALYQQSSQDKIVETIKQMFNLNTVKQIEEKISNQNFQNAIIIYNKIKSSGREVCKELCFKLIQEYLLSNTYPFKNIPKAYPWNDENNQAWLKQLPTPFWLKKFEKEYRITAEDLGEDNTEQRIKHHLEQAKDILNKLGVKLTDQTIKEIEEQYKTLTKKSEEKDLLNDLKTQINALKSLSGQEEERKGIIGGKITIASEFDPLEILQMGNYVNGSCLNTYGANYWSTIINASEVNKRVLWAKNHKGDVIARLLIAVDEDKRIVRFPTYYATSLKLERFFDYYIIELAKKCGFGINGDKNKVLRIFDGGWYADGTILIGEELQEMEKYRRTG
ncbi:hypothetical protein HOA91_06945 [Candidatus Woesearchaeota archaeon]|nr:hypothetical protein [Candidatus Woesearchaeota archaeon]